MGTPVMILIASPRATTRSVAAPAATSATTQVSGLIIRSRIGRNDGIPVDGSVIEWWHQLARNNVGGKYQPRGFFKWQFNW